MLLHFLYAIITNIKEIMPIKTSSTTTGNFIKDVTKSADIIDVDE